MDIKYDVAITAIGNLAKTFLTNNNSAILLDEGIRPNLSDMVLEHTPGKLEEDIKKSDKLLKFMLDDGSGTPRQILSGIHKFYEPEQLVGKTVVAILNLPPRKMMGQDSNGMLLSAVKEVDGKEELHLMILDDKVPVGSQLC